MFNFNDTTTYDVVSDTFKDIPTIGSNIIFDSGLGFSGTITVKPAIIGQVNVVYTTSDGLNTPPTKLISGPIASAYSVPIPTISGYSVGTLPIGATGNFTIDNQTVVIKYLKNPQISESVITTYKDESGNSIAVDLTSKGYVGEEYITNPKIIDGYTLIETPSNETGILSTNTQTVNYIYKKTPVKSGDVVINYVDESNQKITTSTVLSGYIGEQYNSEPIDIEEYSLSVSPTNTYGKFTDVSQIVTYTYRSDEIKSGNVTVRYLDENNNSIFPDQKIEGYIGEIYISSAVNVNNYELVSAPTNSTGILGYNDREVIYSYRKTKTLGANIRVNFLDESGREILPSEYIAGYVGETYNTTLLEIPGFSSISSPYNSNGVINTHEQTVNYYYQSDLNITSNIVVNHLDVNGNKISESETQTGKIGSEYETEQHIIGGYTLTQIPKNSTGIFMLGNSTIDYVYDKSVNVVEGANVKVDYVDQNNNLISSSEILKGNVGYDYEIDIKQIDGYVVDVVPSNSSGRFGNQPQNVVIKYNKVDTISNDVIVRYVDDNNNEIAKRNVITGYVGQEYEVSAIEVPGYNLKVTNEYTQTGVYSLVTFEYSLNSIALGDGIVNISFIDQNSRLPIASNKIVSGTMGSDYEITLDSISGYGLVSEEDSVLSGTFTDTQTNITIEYVGGVSSKVVVKYIGSYGEVLSSDTVLTGMIGEEFEQIPKEIVGYTPINSSNVKGEFTNKNQVVIVNYSKDITTDASIFVDFVDSNNNIIDTRLKYTGQVGETISINAPSIQGYTLKNSTYIEKTFRSQDQFITFSYLQDPIMSGNVTVEYLDTKGNSIIPNATLNGYVGNKYNLSYPDINGYEIYLIPNNISGTYNVKDQVVTFVYKNSKAVSPSVYVHYVDEYNQAISSVKHQSGNINDNYDVSTELYDIDIEGYTKSHVDGLVQGSYTPYDQEIVYHYTSNKMPAAPVIISFVDEYGNKITSDEILGDNKNIGDSYSLVQPDIEGYSKAKSVNTGGVFSQNQQKVTFKYQTNDANVIVRYVDESDTPIANNKVINGDVSDGYEEDFISIDGYTKSDNLPANYIGTFSDTLEIVTFEYTTNPTIAKPVNVVHVDENGNDITHLVTNQNISKLTTLNGNINDLYKAESLEIPGYEVLTMPSNSSGYFKSYEQTVIIRYVKIKPMGQPVYVRHTDESGRDLSYLATNANISNLLVLNGNIGDSYVASSLNIPGYEVYEVPNNTTGAYKTTSQNVNFIYKKTSKIVNNVQVKYVDQSNTSIAPTEYLSGNVGDEFNVVTKSIPGYNLVVTPSSTKSTFTSLSQIFTFKYDKVLVEDESVTIHYIDESNNSIAPNKILTGIIGETYQAPILTIDDYSVLKLPSNSTGSYTSLEQDVFIKYSKNKALSDGIKINFEDVDGVSVAPSVLLSGEVGNSFNYDISQNQIEGYSLLLPGVLDPVTLKPYINRIQTNVSGILTNELQSYTYIYQRNENSVVVKYQDENAKLIRQSDVYDKKVGDSYVTTSYYINGYTLLSNSGNTVGKVGDEEVTVIYTYSKNDVPASDVVVSFIDQSGVKIAEDLILSGNIDERYEVVAPTIDGYTLSVIPVNSNGVFLKMQQNVVIKYTRDPIKSGDVIYHYLDENNNIISDDVIQSGFIGEQYSFVNKKIDGYSLNSVPINASGIFTSENVEVNLIYKKDKEVASDVHVSYINQDGQKLVEDKVINGFVNEPYNVEVLDIDGYSVDKIPQNASGLFGGNSINIVMKYTKDEVVAPDLVINYVDENGINLLPTTILSGFVGDEYTIDVPTINDYELINAPTNLVSKFNSSSNTFDIVYSKVSQTEIQQNEGQVLIKYVDSMGNIIHPTDVVVQTIGTNYQAVIPIIEGYTISPNSSEKNIILSKVNEDVIYTYDKQPQIAGNITINYFDTKKNEISSSITYSDHYIGEMYDFTTVSVLDIDGYSVASLPKNIVGSYNSLDQTINIYYTKDVVPAGTVTTKHILGDDLILSETVQTGNIGDSYTTSILDDPNYKLVSKPIEATGTYTSENIVVEYIYEHESAADKKVTVSYVLENGTSISNEDVLTGIEGNYYYATAKEIPGYTLIKNSGNTVDKFDSSQQNVVFTYKLATTSSNVIVKYMDENNKLVASNEVLVGDINSDYTTNPKLIKGYNLVNSPSNSSGTYSKNTKEVVYIYEKIAKELTITTRYVDINGKEIMPPSVQGVINGQSYIADVKSINGYTMMPIKSVRGVVKNSSITVTLSYESSYSDTTPVVITKYIDEYGNVISNNEVITGVTGSQYNSVLKNIEGYQIIDIPSNVSGAFRAGETVVTIRYSKIAETAAPVTVKYVDQKGELLNTEILKGVVGQEYVTAYPDMVNYTKREDIPLNANGLFSANNQTVVYVYDSNKGGDITVNYQDQNGNKLATEVYSGLIDDELIIGDKSFLGYSLIENPSMALFTLENQTISVVYEKEAVPSQNVNIKYVDQVGNQVAPDYSISGIVGENYKVTPKVISGYVVDDSKLPVETGQFTSSSKTITYVYNQIAGDVVIKYRDVDNNQLPNRQDRVLSGYVGDQFTIEEIVIPGYEIESNGGLITGVYTANTQEITIKYNKVAGNVVVQYLDENENKIIEDSVLTDDVGEEFIVSQRVFAYRELIKVEGTEQSTFTENDQIIKYYYSKEKVPAADVTVRYMDESDNMISSTEILSGIVSEPLISEQKIISGYTFKQINNDSSLFTNQPQTIDYIYSKDIVDGSEVTLNYVDKESRLKIDSDQVIVGEVGTSYESLIDIVEIDGYEMGVVEQNGTGIFSVDAQTIVISYKKIPVVANNINVHFVDEIGNVLDETIILQGNVGDVYNIDTSVLFTGYSLVEEPNNASGVFEEKEKNVY